MRWSKIVLALWMAAVPQSFSGLTNRPPQVKQRVCFTQEAIPPALRFGGIQTFAGLQSRFGAAFKRRFLPFEPGAQSQNFSVTLPAGLSLLTEITSTFSAGPAAVIEEIYSWVEGKALDLWWHIKEMWDALEDYLGHLPKLEVRRATAADQDAFAQIYYNCYVVQKKYFPPNSSRRLLPYQSFMYLPQSRTLVAVKRGRVVGVVNYTLDNTLNGTVDNHASLPMESDFKEEVSRLRRAGKHIGAVWSLAVDPQHQKDNRIVRRLIKMVRQDLKEQGVNAALFAVNPRHKRVYMDLFQMEAIAARESTGGLTNAPAVLLYRDPQLADAEVVGTWFFRKPMPMLIRVKVLGVRRLSRAFAGSA